MPRGPSLVPFADRFWKRVDASGGSDACWDWTGRSFISRGQRVGQLYAGGGAKTPEYEYAPRIAFRLASGQPIPDGLRVLHSCDRPICCNPAHLRLGTQTDNALDRSVRLRDLKVRFRLTEAQVVEIRTRYAETAATTTDLAAEFGTNNKYLWKVVTGRMWAHVGGPISRGSKRYDGSLLVRKYVRHK